MNRYFGLLGVFTILLASSTHAVELPTVAVAETTLIAVAPASSQPADFAAAFGKLVGYYALPNRTFEPVFPQMSVSLNGKSYAAIAVTGKPVAEGPVEVLSLPACRFVRERYVGNYPGLVAKVRSMVASAASEGWAVAPQCGIRVLHLNSPDDTPVDQLIHEVYVPVVKREP